MYPILIVDDDESIRSFLIALFEQEGYTTFSAANGEQALQIFIKNNPMIVILDQRLPDIKGIDLLKKFKSYDPDVNVIIITGYGEIRDAVKAMEAGAINYLLKPLDAQELRIIIRQVQQNLTIKRERDLYRDRLQVICRGRLTPLVYKSKKMEDVLKQINDVAKTNSTVLLEGESGTGKGLFALYIHQTSNRSDGPFIDIDCTTIPENLLESELFGYEPGAFTDARKRKEGLIELAHKGTLFLDEISSMPMVLQGKLLKVIESKSFRKLGGSKEITVDVRIIVATNTNLEEMVNKGTFRKDLFFRINTFPIRLPPLRERREDIAPLAEYFVKEIAQDYHKRIKGITPEALEILEGYDWPGNVRELRNTIEKAVIIARGELITPEDIGLKTVELVREDEIPLNYNQAVNKLEINLLKKALERTQGNQTKAAKLLGVSRNFLIRLMKKHRINPFEFKV
jgi:DNA-binding NtrC family response regulator|uniref:Sigma-54-dependent Fis family transcriptional regulator n=1 Tax=candidate division WOR-3 bacterium TaxID=2052148 RepID=A0A7V3RGM1_UNCW3